MLNLILIALQAGTAMAGSASFQVVRTYPHDASAFTQGLVVHDGKFIESTGLYGQSTLRRVSIEDGQVLERQKLPDEVFGEGLTVLAGRVYQITWQGGRGYVYDAKTFKKERDWSYPGEGWGITHDGKLLILSDGSDELKFIDPKSFKISRAIRVRDEKGKPVRDINELEYVKGEILANIWHSERIARVDPKSGKVKSWIDLSTLGSQAERSSDPEGVLNGIAYDAKSDRLFVTGKLWRRVFEIKLK